MKLEGVNVLIFLSYICQPLFKMRQNHLLVLYFCSMEDFCHHKQCCLCFSSLTVMKTTMATWIQMRKFPMGEWIYWMAVGLPTSMATSTWRVSSFSKSLASKHTYDLSIVCVVIASPLRDLVQALFVSFLLTIFCCSKVPIVYSLFTFVNCRLDV